MSEQLQPSTRFDGPVGGHDHVQKFLTTTVEGINPSIASAMLLETRATFPDPGQRRLLAEQIVRLSTSGTHVPELIMQYTEMLRSEEEPNEFALITGMQGFRGDEFIAVVAGIAGFLREQEDPNIRTNFLAGLNGRIGEAKKGLTDVPTLTLINNQSDALLACLPRNN